MTPHSSSGDCIKIFRTIFSRKNSKKSVNLICSIGATIRKTYTLQLSASVIPKAAICWKTHNTTVEVLANVSQYIVRQTLKQRTLMYSIEQITMLPATFNLDTRNQEISGGCSYPSRMNISPRKEEVSEDVRETMKKYL